MKTPESKTDATGHTPVGITELLAALAGMMPKGKEYVCVVENPKHTRNLFGPLSEIAGKKLELLERNDQGDCLCLFNGRLGTNIVDVDNKDIVAANSQLNQPPA